MANIYRLDAGCRSWEMLHAAVVVADSEDQARELVLPETGREGETPWRSAPCENLGVAMDPTPRIVCTDYFEG